METPMYTEKKGGMVKLEQVVGFAKAIKKTVKRKVIQNGSQITVKSAGYNNGGKSGSMA